MREAGGRGRGSRVCAASALSAPPAPPLTLRLCPFSHPCSEEAKSTTWLHPVTGEAVVTGHRRQSTGNAEPGRARAELGSAGRRRQSPGRPPPRNLPPAAVPREAAKWGGVQRGWPQVEGPTGAPPREFFRVSGRFSVFSFSSPLGDGALSSWALSPIPTWTPPPPLPPPPAQEADSPLPGIWDPEFFFPQPLLNPSTTTLVP